MKVRRQKDSRSSKVSLAALNWRRIVDSYTNTTNLVNVGRPTEFSNEWVEGRTYVRTRASQHQSDTEYFTGRRRLADFQVQLRFKKKPPGKLFVGFEGSRGTPQWGRWTKLLLKIVRGIATSRVPDFVAVFGEEVRAPKIMIPFETFWDYWHVMECVDGVTTSEGIKASWAAAVPLCGKDPIGELSTKQMKAELVKQANTVGWRTDVIYTVVSSASQPAAAVSKRPIDRSGSACLQRPNASIR
eukprot:SAG22_NODE_964_length_6277_cov_12.416316_3_plen_243_part_00